MTTEAAQCFAVVHPDLIYIQITAWATVGLVIATIGMIVWQIKSTKSVAKVHLSMQFMDQYDSMQMRANRQSLASLLLQDRIPGARAMEPILDVLETVADFHQRKWLDASLVENAFSVPARYWWRALESHITKMRSEYQDDTIYEMFQQLANQYNAAGLAQRRAPTISEESLRVFLTSEAA